MRRAQVKRFALKVLQKTTGLKDLMVQRELSRKKRFKYPYGPDFFLD